MRRRLFSTLLIGSLFFAIDLATKAHAALRPGANTGVVYHFVGISPLLLVAPLLTLMVAFMLNRTKSQAACLAGGSLLGGTYGNSYEIARFGAATDWIHIGRVVANIADFEITGGAFFFLLLVLRQHVCERHPAGRRLRVMLAWLPFPFVPLAAGLVLADRLHGGNPVRPSFDATRATRACHGLRARTVPLELTVRPAAEQPASVEFIPAGRFACLRVRFNQPVARTGLVARLEQRGKFAARRGLEATSWARVEGMPGAVAGEAPVIEADGAEISLGFDLRGGLDPDRWIDPAKPLRVLLRVSRLHPDPALGTEQRINNQ